MPGCRAAIASHRPRDQRQLDQLVDLKEARAEAVVDVVIVVGDVVRDRRDLRFEPRPASSSRSRSPFASAIAQLGLGDRPVMLRQPLERLPAQVQAVEIRIGIFEPGHDPKGLRIVIEAAGLGEGGVQRVLAGVAEGRVAEVVRQAQRLGQILVEAERARNRPADLRDLEAVGEANAIMVAVGRDEHLRLVAEPAKGDGVDDSVAVALEGVARPARPGTVFRMEAAARTCGTGGDAGGKGHSPATGTILSESELVQRSASMPTVSEIVREDRGVGGSAERTDDEAGPARPCAT